MKTLTGQPATCLPLAADLTPRGILMPALREALRPLRGQTASLLPEQALRRLRA